MRLFLLSQVNRHLPSFSIVTLMSDYGRIKCKPPIQVEDAAHKKHGGPEGLEEQRKTQLGAKVEKRVAKRKEDSQKVLLCRAFGKVGQWCQALH